MRWVAPPSKDTATATLEKRSRSAADELRANSGLTAVVPYSYQRRVVDAYAGPHRELLRPEAGHNDPLDAAESNQVAGELERLVGAAAPR